MLNIKDALYSGIHTVQENAKKINETVAPGIVHGIETAATKTGDALTAGKNTVVNTGAAAKDAVMEQLDANHDGKVDIEDIIILGLRTPGVKVERNRFLANEFRAHYDAATIEKAVRTTPMKAGISLEEINKIADAVIQHERYFVSGISAALGAPGGAAAGPASARPPGAHPAFRAGRAGPATCREGARRHRDGAAAGLHDRGRPCRLRREPGRYQHPGAGEHAQILPLEDSAELFNVLLRAHALGGGGGG